MQLKALARDVAKRTNFITHLMKCCGHIGFVTFFVGVFFLLRLFCAVAMTEKVIQCSCISYRIMKLLGYVELNNLNRRMLNGKFCERFQSINHAIKLETLFYGIDPIFI